MIFKWRWLFCLGVFTSNAPLAFAEKSTEGSTLETSQERIFTNKKFEDSHVVTDSKLRAEDGSLSRFSMKGSFSYYGPTLQDWTAADQPNPDRAVGSYAQALKGSVMMRYRISSEDSFSAGTGVAAIHPFHGWDRTDVNNPFLSYDHSLRLGPTQMRISPGLTLATVPEYRATGEVGGLTFDGNMVWRIADSRWALSLDTNFSWWIYNRNYRPGSVKSGGDGRAQEYTVSAFPGGKYYLSDRWSLFASYGLQYFNPRELTNKWAWWNRTPSARLGAAVGFGREIYFSGYLSSYPGQAFSQATTVNFSTVFSLL